MSDEAEFDQYANDYADLVNASIRFSGETKDYFAMRRIEFIRERLSNLNIGAIENILDFGCGTGEATPHLQRVFDPKRVLGVDVSEKSLQQARSAYAKADTSFALTSDVPPDGSFDFAYCSGVFHHIPLDARAEAAGYVFDSLKRGGWFALWEHNPWNPGTRFAMSQCPFDHDAIRLRPGIARALLRQAGFDIIETRFYFLFPNALRRLRFLEPHLVRFPLCAQYVVLARRP